MNTFGSIFFAAYTLFIYWRALDRAVMIAALSGPHAEENMLYNVKQDPVEFKEVFGGDECSVKAATKFVRFGSILCLIFDLGIIVASLYCSWLLMNK